MWELTKARATIGSLNTFLNRKDEAILAIRLKPIFIRLNNLCIPEKRYVSNIYLNI